MDELFRPSAFPVRRAIDEYHDAANPYDDPQIEATRRQRQQAAGPRRRISITEREEQTAAAATNASAEAPPLQQLNNEEDVPTEVPTFSADPTTSNRRSYRSATGSDGPSSLVFSHKDLYGSDDEVVEVAQGQIDFSNRNRSRLRSNASFDSKVSGCSSGHGGSMVSVSMAPDNKNAEFDFIGGIISGFYDDNDDDKIPTYNGGEGDKKYNIGQSSCSESDEGRTIYTNEPQASLLTSAVESLKQIPIFGRLNSAQDIPAKKLQRLDGELRKQVEKSNNHADESDHSKTGSSVSSHPPLHLTQQEQTAKQTGGSDDNSLSSVSDSSKNHRKSGGGIPFFGRFQKQNGSKHESNKPDAELTDKADVDDDTPSTNSISCPSPELAPNPKVGEEHAQISLLESAQQQSTHIPSEENKGTRDTDSSIPLTEPRRGSLMNIFTAALSNDENGARKTMGEDEKADILYQLQLLANMDSEHQCLIPLRTIESLGAVFPSLGDSKSKMVANTSRINRMQN